ncbi:monosaccharide ABC transporter ATP-binding protein, CUT2 family [Devosia lucknowensis]|uniref:Monosaccharide ABC transporter ATP-binding protein, CUT2 family n=1 Tax=Devosia lucknowensis TaxID=1096929 RepID=A0A1Y6G6I5_9HYPH|nr:sugar ABC transporter ATP-binding protein [Devosia lucknowensis]SMQ85384.1 monosaccharide ABC transporter ATP-binding protein, CUT2 family [Devosia lucknowensis]
MIDEQVSPGHAAPLMQLSGLGKAYGSVRVLSDVNLDIRPGEIHAIIGENGAGKSTLMRLISGHVKPTEGSIRLAGEEVEFVNPAAAEHAGIALVHQEILLADGLTVVENLFLGREMTRNGVVDDRSMERIASQKLAALGCTASPRALVRSLPIAQRQLVQIARALLEEHRLVIFDEPTAVLTTTEVDTLLGIVRGLRDRGVAILYISHRLNEVEALADRITVLRDGKMIGTYDAVDVSQEDMARLMVGRELAMLYPAKRGPSSEEPVLEIEHLSVPGFVEDASLVARPGEVLGLGGMIGAGRTELFEGLLGLRPAKVSQVRVGGKLVRIGSVADGVEAGIGYLTEDRKGKGLLLRERLAPNLVLTALSRLYRKPYLEQGLEQRELDRAVDEYDIRVRSKRLEAGQLSGGNQQKLLLAKIMMLDPKVVIIDEPTRGIDIGNKSQIYAFIDALIRAGKACIVISSELQELVGLCDRILVMRAGRIVAEFADEAITEEAVVLAATSGGPNAAAGGHH